MMITRFMYFLTWHQFRRSSLVRRLNLQAVDPASLEKTKRSKTQTNWFSIDENFGKSELLKERIKNLKDQKATQNFHSCHKALLQADEINKCSQETYQYLKVGWPRRMNLLPAKSGDFQIPRCPEISMCMVLSCPIKEPVQRHLVKFFFSAVVVEESKSPSGFPSLFFF